MDPESKGSQNDFSHVPELKLEPSISSKANYNDNTQNYNDNTQKFSFFHFISNEFGLTSPMSFIRNKDDNISRIKHILKVPISLEPLLFFGFSICFDSFLFLFSFLPLRVIFAIVTLVTRPTRFTNKHLFDILRFSLLIIIAYALSYIDISYIYHYIRGQSVLKFYVIFNMITIVERLCSSFGEDILDILCNDCTALFNNNSMGSIFTLVIDYCICVVYLFIHSSVILIDMVTVNAAINTSNALFTLLLSNNFNELKATVFKKFTKENLFQILCSDCVERFTLFIFYTSIVITISTDYYYKTTNSLFFIEKEWIAECASLAFYIFGMEIIVDWLKHSFIVKFNLHFPQLYNKYLNILCSDVASCRSKTENNLPLDYSHAVSRRLGFVPLPLACFSIRMIFFKFLNSSYVDQSFYLQFLLLFMIFICTIVLKLLISILLVGFSIQKLLTGSEKAKEEGEFLSKEEINDYPNRYVLTGTRIP